MNSNIELRQPDKDPDAGLPDRKNKNDMNDLFRSRNEDKIAIELCIRAKDEPARSSEIESWLTSFGLS